MHNTLRAKTPCTACTITALPSTSRPDSAHCTPPASPQLLSKRVKPGSGFIADHKAGDAHQAAVHNRLLPTEGWNEALQMLLRCTVRLRSSHIFLPRSNATTVAHTSNPGPETLSANCNMTPSAEIVCHLERYHAYGPKCSRVSGCHSHAPAIRDCRGPRCNNSQRRKTYLIIIFKLPNMSCRPTV